MDRNKLLTVLKELQSNRQKEQVEAIKEISRYVRPEWVNTWPNCVC